MLPYSKENRKTEKTEHLKIFTSERIVNDKFRVIRLCEAIIFHDQLFCFDVEIITKHVWKIYQKLVYSFV